MAKSATLNVTQRTTHAAGNILPADTTTKKTIYTASADDAVIKTLNITSTDTAAMNVQLYVNDGTADRLLGTIPVPALSGTNGTVISVDMLDGSKIPGLAYDMNGKRILALKAGAIVKVAVLVTVTAAKQIDIYGTVEEF